jgi:hypothetical protein
MGLAGSRAMRLDRRMLSDFFSYLWLLGGYARWLLAGGPFLVDTLIKKLRPDWSRKIDEFVLPRTRQRVEISFVLIAIFLAGFLTWRDEHIAQMSIGGHSRDNARHLTMDEQMRLQMNLKLSPEENYHMEINSVQNCDECEDYAQELREFISTLPGWKADGSVLTFAGYPYRYGLGLSVNTASAQKLNRIVVSAFDSASIHLRQEPSAAYTNGIDAVIVVARPSR